MSIYYTRQLVISLTVDHAVTNLLPMMLQTNIISVEEFVHENRAEYIIKNFHIFLERVGS